MINVSNWLVASGAGSERCEPGDQEEADRLSVDVVPRPGAHVGVLGRLKAEKLGSGLIDIRLRLAEKRQGAIEDPFVRGECD